MRSATHLAILLLLCTNITTQDKNHKEAIKRLDSCLRAKVVTNQTQQLPKETSEHNLLISHTIIFFNNAKHYILILSDYPKWNGWWGHGTHISQRIMSSSSNYNHCHNVSIVIFLRELTGYNWLLCKQWCHIYLRSNSSTVHWLQTDHPWYN